MKLLVNVTREDVQLGQRKKGYACMVHRAIERCSEGAFSGDGLHVLCCSIRFARPGGRMLEVRLPERVMGKILRWDSGVNVRPFAFELELPEELLG